MNKKVYCYSLCYEESGEYIPDRGVVFAESVKEAVSIVIDSIGKGNFDVVDITVFRIDYKEDTNCISFYQVLSDCDTTKNELSWELKDWSLI